MYCRWMLFKLEIKRLTGMLPLILMETLFFGFIIFGVGAFATRAMYGEKAVGEIKVGIVADDEDSLTGMLVKFVQSMDSVKDTTSLVLLSEEEARAQIAKGEIYAAILMPEGIVDSIISGENFPATILLDKGSSRMETEVFEQLTRAGAKLLTIAQAGIYAADEFCMENGMQSHIQQTEDYLNKAYLNYALGRTSFFRIKEVNAVKGVTLTDYYGISLLLAFLSFAGLSLGRYIQVRMGERKRLLRTRGVSIRSQYLIETGAFAGVFALMGMLISVPLYFVFIRCVESSFRAAFTWIFLAAIWCTIGVFIRALLQITGNGAGGIGVCFVILLVLMFASGVFIPTAFLPIWLEKAGNYFPYRGWMEAMAVILQGRFEGEIVLKLLMQIIIFLVIGMLMAEVFQNGEMNE